MNKIDRVLFYLRSPLKKTRLASVEKLKSGAFASAGGRVLDKLDTVLRMGLIGVFISSFGKNLRFY